MENRERALSLRDALRVNSVENYKEIQHQPSLQVQVRGIMKKSLSDYNRIIIRSLGYERSQEEYKENQEKVCFV